MDTNTEQLVNDLCRYIPRKSFYVSIAIGENTNLSGYTKPEQSSLIKPGLYYFSDGDRFNGNLELNDVESIQVIKNPPKKAYRIQLKNDGQMTIIV